MTVAPGRDLIGAMKFVVGLALAFALGAVCRYFDVPAPGPPKLFGALLVVAITAGYVTVDRVLGAPSTPSERGE